MFEFSVVSLCFGTRWISASLTAPDPTPLIGESGTSHFDLCAVLPSARKYGKAPCVPFGPLNYSPDNPGLIGEDSGGDFAQETSF